MNRAYTYKGRDIDTLTQEELLIAVRWAWDRLEDDRRFHRENVEMERLFLDVEQAIGARRYCLVTSRRI